MAKLFNAATNKQGLIVYGGEASSDYGMVVSEAPTFERATRKQTTYDVPGKNGAVIFQQDAWNDVQRTYKVWLTASGEDNLTTAVDAVEAWLNTKKGYARLEDSFEPEVYRLAYYSGGSSITNNLMQYGETSLTFTCRPERFYKSGEQPLTVNNGSKINNTTRFDAKPLLHIEGSGTVTVSISGVTITASLSDYINIDCETMNAYRLPAENKNSQISGSFPKITPGVNTIATTGSVSKLEITPRFYTI